MIAAAPLVSVAPQNANAVNAPSSSTNLTPRVASFIRSNPSRPTRSRARRQVRPCGTRGERHDVQIPSRVPGAASRAVCRVATDRCEPAAARCLLLGRRRAPCPGRAVDAWFPLIGSVRLPAPQDSSWAKPGVRRRCWRRTVGQFGRLSACSSALWPSFAISGSAKRGVQPWYSPQVNLLFELNCAASQGARLLARQGWQS